MHMVLGDQKGRGVPPHNKCEHTPFSLCTGIHLGKMCTHAGRDVGGPGMPKKRDNWSEENKDPEEVPCVSDLNHLYVYSSLGGCSHPSLKCIFLPCSYLKQTNYFSVCFSICCAVLIIKYTFFFFFLVASLKHSCFQTGTRARTTSSL